MATPTWRSYCPVARTLDLVGDRWTLLVVRDLLLGMSRYEEFRARPEGIATNVLAERLKRLEELGYVERRPYGSHARRFEYHLTRQGETLRPLVQAIVDWGLAHLPGSEIKRWPSDRPKNNNRSTTRTSRNKTTGGQR